MARRGRAASDSWSGLPAKLRQQRLGVLQVGGVEAFGEPVVERGEERAGLVASALVAEQARQAGGGPQLEPLRLLFPRDPERAPEEVSRLFARTAALVQEDLGPQPMEL